jgi:predicted kinase
VNVVRRLVYVSGAPGSGKSTLAEPLAASLGFALLGKDIIKETLHGVLGPPTSTGPGHGSWARPRWNSCGRWRRARPRC